MDKIIAEGFLESWRIKNCPHFPIFFISERDLGPCKEIKNKLLSSCISFIPESNFSPKGIPRTSFIGRYLDATLLPNLIHITHSDGGIEDVVQAAGGGLQARGGEAAHVLGDVIAEEIHGEDDAGNNYPGP